MIVSDYTQLIGRTPMLEIRRLVERPSARVLAKLEMFNPMSIKDRAVLFMIRALAEQGKLGADTEVVAAIAYCRTPEVEDAWRDVRPDVPWPLITLRADVCRDNLLFEIEATACPGARTP